MQFPEIGLWEVFVRWYSVYWSSNPYGTSIAVMMVFSGLLLALVAKGRIWISSEAGILKPLLATILGLGFSFVFLAESKVVLYEWQFIIPMVFVGFQSSLLLKTVLRESFLEKVLMVGALLLSWLPIERPLNYLGQRTTNLDLISRYLERNYKDSDLIIINPWEPAISFAYYYKGAGEFITIPPVSKTDTHRADEIQGAMAQPVKTLFQTIEPRIAKALKNDGRVYLIGDFSPPLHGADPLVLETAPNPLWGWKGGAYYQMWSEQLAAVLISKAASADLLTPEINANEKISRYENIQVIRFNAK